MSEPAPVDGLPRMDAAASGPWRGQAARPMGERLRHLAARGDAERVRVLFETLTPAERTRQADPDVLRQVAVSSLARLTTFPSEALDREREFLESVVQLLVSDCQARGIFPRELFRTLLDWSEELLRVSRLDEARDVCELSLTLGVRRYPDLWPWVQVCRARAETLLGNLEAAHATLLETYRRPDRIADRRAVPALLELLGSVSLETRRSQLFGKLLIERLRVFHTDAAERRAAVDLMLRAHRGLLRLLGSRALSVGDKLLWLTHWSCLGTARGIGWPPLARLFEAFSAGSAYVVEYGLRTRTIGASASGGVEIDATLVTRAMGGLGDFLMMTPGLRALKGMRPTRPVVLAIPRRFFPLFDGNTDVQLRDLDEDLDPASYVEWFDLTDCPAARVESRTAPAVRANRIELFARGLGVTGLRLKTMGRRPHYVVPDAERQWRDQFFADHGLRGAVLVGVQARSDEPYRDVPHMRQIVEALARHARVLVFGRTMPPGGGHPGVVEVTGLDVRKAFALASGCDVLVTPDSAFFHLAGALDLPCVGLFGPTDGRVRGRDYPRARILDARQTLPCIPCWRNEATPCGLTGLRPSPCLGEIDPVDVVRAVVEAIDAGPGRLGAGT